MPPPIIHNERRGEQRRTPVGEAWITAGILWHRIDADTAIDYEKASATVDALADIVGSARVPAVVDIRGVTFADRKARKVFSEEVGFELATALIVESNVSKALGNAYLSFSRPSRPTKLFTSINKARVWAYDFVASA